MADIISANAPVAARRIELPRLRLPWRGLVATFKAMPDALNRALTMAYVAPYSSRHQPVVPDENLDGRDPGW